MKVILKTILSSPLLVNEDEELRDLPNPVPRFWTRITIINDIAKTICKTSNRMFIFYII